VIHRGNKSRVLLALGAMCVLMTVARAEVTRAPREFAFAAEEWLREPDCAEIPWHIQIMPPRLTLMERQLVEVRAEMRATDLQKRSVKRTLQVLAKVADEDGDWFEDESYAQIVLDKPISKKDSLEFVVGVFLRPGKYQVALVMYDTELKQRNVGRKWIEVAPLKNDPLPQLESGLPAVEFVDQVGQGWQFPAARLTLPVKARHPVEVDVLVNFSPSALYTGRTRALRRNVSAFLQITHVLSQLDVEPGCVRLSGIDVLGLKVLFEDVDPETADWDKIVRAALQVSAPVVDVGTLQGRKETAAFFSNFMQRTVKEARPACRGPRGERPERAYIVAGSGMLFPNGTHVEPMPPVPCECRVYYLRGHLEYGAMWDEMERVMKPLRPRRLDVEGAEQFRSALASIVADLEGPAPR
jgi:hypothetical protein